MVSFDTVEIREYPIVLSDNPATRRGPSLELGWEYRLASEIHPIDHISTGGEEYAKINAGRLSVYEYEMLRPSSQRRPMHKLYLFQPTREHRIRMHHFTVTEIREVEIVKSQIRQSRERSNVCRNPLTLVRKDCRESVRRSKVKRAVRNLKKPNCEMSDPLTTANGIYNGWWLPLSAHLF